MIRLDIDPANLEFDFERHWKMFADSNGRVIRQFFLAWLDKRYHELHRRMENCSSDELPKLQGAIDELKKFKELVSRDHPVETVKEVIAHLKQTYGQ